MTPGGTACGLASAIILLLAALFLLTGCVHVVTEPALPLPERPDIRFFRCGLQDMWVCLTEADANALLRYVQKLNEWERARAELLR
jgi:hypothetical protein